MKKVLLLFIFISVYLLPFNSYSQTWLWNKAISGSGHAMLGTDVIQVNTDQSGNVYITGVYGDSASFGAVYIKTPNGDGNPFLAKYDNNGNFLWVAACNGTAQVYNYPFASITDAAGNTYIAGDFNDSMSVGSTYLKTPNGYYDMFLIKYSSTGHLIWKYQAGLAKGSSADAEDIALDKNGNVYVTGKFSDTLVIGNDSLKDGNSYGNIYIAKFDTSGKFLQMEEGKSSAGIENMGGLALKADPFGSVYLYGTYYDTLKFGSNVMFTDYSNPNMFLIKYDSLGNVRWTRTCTFNSANSFLYNAEDAYARPMTIDNAGNIYIINGFWYSIKFGSYILPGGHAEDNFITKYDTAGNVLWARDWFAPTNTSSFGWAGNSLKADKLGHLYFAGAITDSANISGTIISCDTIYDPAFLVKMDTSANIICSTYITISNVDRSPVAPDPLADDVFFSGDAEWNLAYCYFGTNLVLNPGTGGEWGILGKWECEPTQVNNVTEKEQSILYPNPNHGAFTLQLAVASGQGSGKSQIEIYNMLGEKVYSNSFNIQNSTFEINVIGQPEGVYMYRVLNEEGKQLATGKFVVE